MTLWEGRDLPVLRALAEPIDEQVRDGYLWLTGEATGAERLGVTLSNTEIWDAILTLADAGYVTCEAHETNYRGGFTHLSVTGRGLQALGQWPLFEEIASPATLALLLERLAEEAPSEEESSNMRRAASYVRKLSVPVVRAAATGALTWWVRHQAGIG